MSTDHDRFRDDMTRLTNMLVQIMEHGKPATEGEAQTVLFTMLRTALPTADDLLRFQRVLHTVMALTPRLNLIVQLDAANRLQQAQANDPLRTTPDGLVTPNDGRRIITNDN